MKLNWQLLWQKAKLGRFDVLVSVVVALLLTLIIILGAVADSSQNAAVKTTLIGSVNEVVQNTLSWLDSFETTDAAVTFMFWGFVGLVSYGVVNVLGSMRREVEYERELTTDEYVRPVRKTKRDIVLAELVDTLARAVGIVALAFSAGVLLFAILPAAVTNIRLAVFQLSPGTVLTAAAASLLVAAGLCSAIFGLRTLLYHRVLLDG